MGGTEALNGNFALKKLEIPVRVVFGTSALRPSFSLSQLDESRSEMVTCHLHLFLLSATRPAALTQATRNAKYACSHPDLDNSGCMLYRIGSLGRSALSIHRRAIPGSFHISRSAAIMPPRRAAAAAGAAKRKANTEETSAKAEQATSPPVSNGNGASAKRAKKSKSEDDAERSPAAPSGNDILAAEGLPKNTSMPDKLEFTRPADGCVRITAWNITSLKSSEPKGLFRYIDAEDADIVVLSETKVNDVPQHPKLSAYPHQYWGIGKTKGYAGLAILSKVKPAKVTYGLPTLKDADSKGRIITLEFEHTILIGTYAVNAGEGLKSMQNKIAWNEAFARFVAECDARKPVVWCGDLNVVMDDRDLAAASKKWNKSPGYTQVRPHLCSCPLFSDRTDLPLLSQIECDAHRALLDATATTDSKPLVDVWRAKHPHAVGHFCKPPLLSPFIRVRSPLSNNLSHYEQRFMDGVACADPRESVGVSTALS